jgi:hypothetical protein
VAVGEGIEVSGGGNYGVFLFDGQQIPNPYIYPYLKPLSNPYLTLI